MALPDVAGAPELHGVCPRGTTWANYQKNIKVEKVVDYLFGVVGNIAQHKVQLREELLAENRILNKNQVALQKHLITN